MKAFLRQLFERLLHLDFIGIDGKKKYIGILLYLAHVFIPGFPKLDLETLNGLSVDQIILLWGVISDAYKKVVK